MPKGGVIIIILLMTWSFLVIILSNAYQGLIMSSVLVPKLTPVINSLEDLPMSSLNIIVYKGTSVETMIKVVKLELINQIIRNNRLRSNFPGNRRERQHFLAAKTKTQ